MKYEDLSEEIRTTIHDEWNDFSNELVMKSEDGKFFLSDIAKAFYAGIDSVLKQFGWHSASELPVIPEGKNWVKVVALVDYGDNTLRPRHEIYKDKGWSKEDMWTVKYWCYPPEEE